SCAAINASPFCYLANGNHSKSCAAAIIPAIPRRNLPCNIFLPATKIKMTFSSPKNHRRHADGMPIPSVCIPSASLLRTILGGLIGLWIAGIILLFALVLMATSSHAALTHMRFINPIGLTPYTNTLPIVSCTTNIQGDGGIKISGLPWRATPNTNGDYTTPNLGQGYYAVQEYGIVFESYDSSATLYDITNVMRSGFNNFVTVIYGQGP